MSIMRDLTCAAALAGLAICGALAPALAAGTGAGAMKPGHHFLENWDQNGDGQVTVAEAQSRRSDVFASFDANDDGMLDATEYLTFDEARANDQANNGGQMGKGRADPAEGMRLEANDIDGDGKVSKDEFQARAADWIASIDRNGDGVVTQADFGPRS
ncbi:EF-hand domain-containing protein [Pannonibacter sp. SL95]|uniref:EF-hand domain-containing protein n=1 Tax=Pannonibacter sp. SL95 TaxID=2995153 RepID=UPI0022749432|nr:EF-hand domain-containing protein [Pannonibacter sp. SL95]MCY1706386.1 EF-hand domain-containing protein [Pannonibacter sp. SL95]